MRFEDVSKTDDNSRGNALDAERQKNCSNESLALSFWRYARANYM
jgi:hypothetical protein